MIYTGIYLLYKAFFSCREIQFLFSYLHLHISHRFLFKKFKFMFLNNDVKYVLYMLVICYIHIKYVSYMLYMLHLKLTYTSAMVSCSRSSISRTRVSRSSSFFFRVSSNALTFASNSCTSNSCCAMVVSFYRNIDDNIDSSLLYLGIEVQLMSIR